MGQFSIFYGLFGIFLRTPFKTVIHLASCYCIQISLKLQLAFLFVLPEVLLPFLSFPIDVLYIPGIIFS